MKFREKDRLRQTLGYLPREFGVSPSVSAERLLERCKPRPYES